MAKIVLPPPMIVLTGTQYDAAGTNLGVKTIRINGATSKSVPVDGDVKADKTFYAIQKLYFGPDLKVDFVLATIPAGTALAGDADYTLRTATAAIIAPNATVFYGDLAGIMSDSEQAKHA